MKNNSGFTLIELLLFIVITSILAKTILVFFGAELKSNPTVHNQLVAIETASQCMEWFVGQNSLNGYSSITCPSAVVPAFCTTPAGFTLAVACAATTIASDTNYKTITVTISGNADLVLTTILGQY
jgi:type II secretory pathway pseudopilin PulG